MHLQGIFIGLGTFLIIGFLHPAVVWGEYYFTKKIWPLFLAGGVGALGASLFAAPLLAGLLGVLGFSLLWSIKELFEQEERVNKGWSKKTPKRNNEKGKGD